MPPIPTAPMDASPAITCDEALRIARLDAERAYRDLSPYRILIAKESDGWHVDYDLPDLHVAGGGPSYVINATSGQIVSKAYYQ